MVDVGTRSQDRAAAPVDIRTVFKGAHTARTAMARSRLALAGAGSAEAAAGSRKIWLRQYVGLLVLTDFIACVVAANTALVFRFPGGDHATANGLTALLMPLVGISVIAFNRGYEGRFVGVGAEEFRRVGRSFGVLIASIATVSYAFRVELARGFVLMAVPLAMVLALGGRYAARKGLHRNRAKGRALNKVLLVGDAASVEEFSGLLDRDRYAGMSVVGACLPYEQVNLETAASLSQLNVPVLGDVDSLLAAIESSGADTVAVVSASAIGTKKLRWISWALEGRTTELVVAPGLVEVAGTRLHIQPVAGLPLLHVDEPEFSGFRRVLKGGFDRVAATFALVLLAPLLALVALAVRIDSRGPAFFRQTRVGRHGETFTMWKFRSMYVDAEARLAEVQSHHEAGHVLFKSKDDPRITCVGKWLRKLSIDELPQLFNVALGSMSLVGPRPPLPSEVAKYEDHVHRRLLVKPGLTGLWQISGRSDLGWEESVRLDLRYVENWSLATDLMIIWKTAFAVLKGSGAY